ncbi:ATP-binding protein [Pyrodictium abyssi]|uniref:ATP-binding protein n=1 Tax=Pyrodictium abyssi TaxID=54256 RepID=A0ABN6ZRG0_9CREN|nr:ATP-binding protein [Pyrodictium abyssi]
MRRRGRGGEPIGMVTGDSRPDYFVFTVDPDNIPPLYDYVYVEAWETPPGEDTRVTVKILAQIRAVRRLAVGVSPEHPWPVLRNLSLPRGSDTVVAAARVLGYKWKGRIYLPRHAPPVGSWVYLAPDELLEDFYSVDKPRRLHVGSLISRPSVPAYLDLEGVKRHVAIIAATGAGKTWASVVLIEELLKKGATIVVLDPHGEYTAMKRTVFRLGPGFENAVRVIKGRRDQEGDIQYRVSVADMSPEELASIAGVPAKATRIRSVIYGAKRLARWVAEATGQRKWLGLRGMIKVVHAAIDAVEVARLQGGRLDRFAAELLRRLSVAVSQDLYKAAATGRRLEELLAADERLGRGIRRLWLALGKDSSPGYDAIRYLEELRRIGVYGVGSLPLDQLLEPGTVTVVNLAGLRAEVQDHLAFNILARIFNARLRYVRGVDGESYPYPVVIVVEEAHRFMPPKSQKQTRSRDVAATIASEGRKFGVFLVAITQRPSRIDPDVLSQLQGQIILRIVNPRDQEAIRDSSEQVSQDLLDNLPGLNTGEAVVVGPLAPSPLMIRLRDRVLDYSGGDLSLVEAWAGGREDLRLVEELRAEALEKAGQLLGEQPPDLAEAVAAIAGLDPAPETVERALRLLAREQVWASYSEETGTVYGEVMTGSGYSYEARVSLPERRSSCSCRARQPCSHAVAVLLRALLDGLLAVPRQQPSEPEGWWSEFL